MKGCDIMSEENNEKNDFDFERIKETSAAEIETGSGKIFCLTIIGQIEGHELLPPQSKTTKYEHVIPLLASIEEDKEIKGLLVILNTMGGDVEAGLAISEMISGMKKPTVSLVLGGGHSIGVPLAVSSKYSFIAPSATMTVHPVRFSGTIIGVPQAFQYLVKMQERIVKFVVSNSKIKEKELKSLLSETGEMANDVGSILSGDDAVKCGLIDEVGNISTAIEKLNELIKTMG